MCFQYIDSFAQNQKIADSLTKIYKEEGLQGAAKLELLESLSFNEVNNLELSLKYAEELVAQAKLDSNSEFLSRGYTQIGNKNRLLGNLDIALDAFFKSVEAATMARSIKIEGVANMSIADIYSLKGNSSNAET